MSPFFCKSLIESVFLSEILSRIGLLILSIFKSFWTLKPCDLKNSSTFVSSSANAEPSISSMIRSLPYSIGYSKYNFAYYHCQLQPLVFSTIIFYSSDNIQDDKRWQRRNGHTDKISSSKFFESPDCAAFFIFLYRAVYRWEEAIAICKQDITGNKAHIFHAIKHFKKDICLSKQISPNWQYQSTLKLKP